MVPEQKEKTEHLLKSLNDENLATLAPYLSPSHLWLLDYNQLNVLPWEKLTDKIPHLFLIDDVDDRANRTESQKRLHSLNEKSLAIVTPCLSEAHLKLLDPSLVSSG